MSLYPFLDNKSILVTGGTGSFGTAFCTHLAREARMRRLVVYSRDEFKQLKLRQLPELQGAPIEFCLGDVRDRRRLRHAMQGIDIVIHAAALKQVPASEQHPYEFIQTNILGAINVLEAAQEAQLERVLAISTDKAVQPVNLYGATKLCSDKIFLAGNSPQLRCSVVRYGNVMGSRGSVLELFLQQKKQGVLTLTDPTMTRFFLTLEQAIHFVTGCLCQMQGGEVFIPKVPSASVQELAMAVAPECQHHTVGPRPGEKPHEVLLSAEEAPYALEYADHFRLKPLESPQTPSKPGSRRCPLGFRYSSDQNAQRFSLEALRELCNPGLETSLMA